MGPVQASETQNVLPAQRVRLADDAAQVLVPGQGACPAPQVHLIRDGNTIQAVEIACTCGQRIRLTCVYQ
jgi:hypothetical protein